MACRTTAGGARVEGWRYCERGSVCIVDVGDDPSAGGIAPDDVDCILALIVRVFGLAKQVHRA
jgi:hypothetical protein